MNFELNVKAVFNYVKTINIHMFMCKLSQKLFTRHVNVRKILTDVEVTGRIIGIL